MGSGNMWERWCLDWVLATATLDGADFSGGEASLRLVLGASLAGLAILCDSFVSTFEQCTIFSRETRPPPAELVLYTYAMAAFQSFLVFVSSDEPQHAYTFFSANPTLLAKMFCSEIFGYASISMVVRLVAHYGATNAEVAKTARKGVVLFFSLVVIEGKAIKGRPGPRRFGFFGRHGGFRGGEAAAEAAVSSSAVPAGFYRGACVIFSSLRGYATIALFASVLHR